MLQGDLFRIDRSAGHDIWQIRNNCVLLLENGTHPKNLRAPAYFTASSFTGINIVRKTGAPTICFITQFLPEQKKSIRYRRFIRRFRYDLGTAKPRVCPFMTGLFSISCGVFFEKVGSFASRCYGPWDRKAADIVRLFISEKWIGHEFGICIYIVVYMFD